MVVQENASGAAVPPPAVMWAQKSDVVFLTYCLEDCHDADITFSPNSISFRGTGGTENKLHELTIDLNKEIDPSVCVKTVRERNIEVVLKKKEAGYWPYLTKEKKKYHWLKVDFNRWEDEESTDEEGGGKEEDIEEIMRSMGGLGGGDGGKPSFDDLDDSALDSDDEELPELE